MQTNYFNTTSKVLTWVILAFYIIMAFLTVFCKIVFKVDILDILSFAQQLMVIVILSYFGKSGLENVIPTIVEKINTANKKQE